MVAQAFSGSLVGRGAEAGVWSQCGLCDRTSVTEQGYMSWEKVGGQTVRRTERGTGKGFLRRKDSCARHWSNPLFLAIANVWEYISTKANNGHLLSSCLGVQHLKKQTPVHRSYVFHVLQLWGWAMPLPGVAVPGSGAAWLHILGTLGPKGLLTSLLALWVIFLSFMRIFIYASWHLRGMKGDTLLKGWKKILACGELCWH